MKITKKSEYALRALVQIALHDGEGVVRARDIAEKENMSVKFLEQVLALCHKTAPLSRMQLPGWWERSGPE